ncbi:MAG: DUF167 domain-containing protein [Phycisphaerae bacterium]|nr:DUF167 domain-containing protein [Phycisphaerae bacterium]
MKDVKKIAIRDISGGAVISVKVVPGSSRDKIAGVLGDALKITTSAAPEKGKANAAITRILAKALGIEQRAVSLHSGPTNPRKEFLIEGMTAGEIRRRLCG